MSIVSIVISAVSALSTVAAVGVALWLPSLRNQKQKKQRIRQIIANIDLYLDCLKKKLEKLSNQNIIIKGEFEEANKDNFNAIENQFLTSTDVLEGDLQNCIRKLIVFFKTNSPINSVQIGFINEYLDLIHGETVNLGG